MPNAVSKKWKSNKLVSRIDQRLAASLHHRQIETIVHVETIADRVVNAIELGTSTVVLEVKQGRSPEKYFTKLFTQIQNDLLNSFVRIAHLSHHTLVDSYFESIPTKWFKSLVTPEAAIALEDDQGEFGDIGNLIFETPTEPIINDPNLSDDEKRELVEKLIFPAPSVREVAEIVSRADSNTGISWQERFENHSRQITSNRSAFDAIVTGYAAGENVEEVRQRIEPLVSGIRSSARRIARTEGLRVANRIQKRSWDSLGEMMIGAQILAVLDENTRPHHSSRNGTIYYKKPVGDQKSLNEMPDLPDEVNCRCWPTPVLAPPREFESDPQVKDSFRTASGSGIPDPASYDDWFQRADVGRRKMAVGVRRYNEVRKQLARIRDPEWSDFIDDEGKLLSISDLKNESASDRQTRKISVADAIRLRGDLRTAVSTRGFVFPRTTPTFVAGQTFTGEVDATSQASLIGELVRSKVSKGLTGELEYREVGRIVREYIETDTLKRLVKLEKRLAFQVEKLHHKRKLKESEIETLRRSEPEVVRLRREIIEIKQARYLEILSSIRDMGSKNAHPTSPGSDVNIERLLNESQRFFPADWISKMHKAGALRTRFVSRGYYSHSQSEIAVSDNGLRGRRSTMPHELVHRAESVIPGLARIEKEFFEWRTKRNKLREISYIPGEFTYRDSWLGNRKNGYGEYMGKKYRSENFEIGTMAIEGILFGTYPIEDDREVYDLILGLLAGL